MPHPNSAGEKYLPSNATLHEEGPRNQICLGQMGIDTWVRSWVPSGEMIGMVIRHGESFTLSDYLTIWENNKVVYRPSVYYAYCPADYALSSLYELKMRQYHLQEKQRIVKDEIIAGSDELGVLLMGHDFNAWWVGSVLDIHTARRLVPKQNATLLQVAISVISALQWIIKNPNEGINVPDNLPYKEIMDTARPYLGKMISMQVSWSPKHDNRPGYLKYVRPQCKEKDKWQFQSFLM